ncbi:hypothetical protein FOA52_002731 [Chlamydomonas sp. UWO 241]|nr:hypothetical protein FOA52_002731 [Chlamydomonas sp. UWO 241]
MSSAARKVVSRRYQLAKLWTAAEEAVHSVFSPKTPGQSQVMAEGVWQQAMHKFQETYTKQMTSSMYIAGTAMCPVLNSAGKSDPAAVEKLVIRSLPRPSARTVWVGDVVAFSSPLAKAGDASANVLVRRVAAMEGMEMVASNGELAANAAQDDPSDDFSIPAGHCWVLADNPDLAPPDVIDSRSFGFIPMTNILGRVIYAGTSARSHGAVTNSPLAQMMASAVIEEEVDMMDAAVIEEEVDVDELFAESDKVTGSSGAGGEGKAEAGQGSPKQE